MSSPFAKPAPPGEGITWADLKGSLLLIDVLGFEEGIKTTFGESDAVRADVVVLDGDQKGEEYPNTLIFPKVLISQTRSQIGSKILGRLTQGEAKPGQSPPWMLSEATEQDQQVGLSYLNSKQTAQPDQPQKQDDGATVPF